MHAFTETQVEQELPAGLSEGQVAEFVEDEEIEATEGISGSALAIITRLDVQLVDEIDGVEEPPTGTVADACAGDADSKMG